MTEQQLREILAAIHGSDARLDQFVREFSGALAMLTERLVRVETRIGNFMTPLDLMSRLENARPAPAPPRGPSWPDTLKFVGVLISLGGAAFALGRLI